MRNHPVFGRFIMHAGIDIAAAEGTTIAAAATGRVILAQYAGNCGNMITIDHGGGMATNYCHLSQIFVGVGQDVAARASHRRGWHDRGCDRSASSFRGTD